MLTILLEGSIAIALPEFNRDGNLLPGIHETDWAEFAERFGRTAERQVILTRLHGALELLHNHGCRRVWIGGSFVTDAERVSGRSPADIDVCWELDGVDLVRMTNTAPELHPLYADRNAQRQNFGGDYFPVSEPLVLGMVERFQRDRHSRQRGIVTFALE